MAGAGPEEVVLLFQNDGGEALLAELNAEELGHSVEEVREVLTAYLGVVRDSLNALCAMPEFSHVRLVETNNEGPRQSPICLGAATPKAGADGEVEGAVAVRPLLDLQALLTAKADCSTVFGDKVAADEEGVVQFVDAKLGKKIDRILKTFKHADMLQAALSEPQEQLLVDALMSLAPPLLQEEEEEEEEEEEGEEGEKEAKGEQILEPVHPADMLVLLAAYLADVIGETPQLSGNPFAAIGSFVGGVFGAGARRVRSLRKVVWQMEDLAIGGARLAGRVVRRSVRPVLLGLVLNRVLTTLDRSRLPELRMARMSPADQIEYHYSRLLGTDWREQMEADFLEAAREVQDGLLTEDYKDEKRKLTAAMLRRLEIEDWDKERMKHFYYGSYGLGSWYFDMEERLHNPYFMGARGWNGPIEQWVGKNKRYTDDIPLSNIDFNSAALDLIESSKGVSLTPEQRARVADKNRVNRTDMLLGSDILTRVVDKAKLKQALA